MFWQVNDDCARAVFSLLEGDYQTLFNLLTVSKAAFRLAVVVLYKDPWASQTPPSAFSRSRLHYLLGLCSGYLHQVYGIDARPAWSDHVTLPTTVNYFALLPQLKSITVLMGYQSWWKAPVPNVQTDTLEPHIRCHGTKFKELHIPHWALDFMLPLVPRLEMMQDVHFSHFQSWALSELDREMVLEIVRMHQKLFPGVLKIIQISFPSQNWEFYMTLQQMLGTPSTVHLTVSNDVDMSLLPTEEIRDLKMSDWKIKVDQVKLFARCLKLEKLQLCALQPDAFKSQFLLMEKSAGAHCQLQQQQQQHHQQEQYQHYQSRIQRQCLSAPTIPPLRSLTLQNSQAKDVIQAMCAFRHTLEEVYIFGNNAMGLISAFQVEFPKLKLLYFTFQEVEIDFPDRLFPALESFKIDGGAICPLPSKCLPTKLSYLHLYRIYPSSSAQGKQDEWLLKPLVNLQELHLSCGKNLGLLPVLQPTKSLTRNEGWLFPKLKVVSLYGQWSSLQGMFLAISPKLESLSIVGNFGLRVGLDVRTFQISSLTERESNDAQGTEDSSNKDETFSIDSGKDENNQVWYKHKALRHLQFEYVTLRRTENQTEWLKRILSGNEGMFPNLEQVRFHHINTTDNHGLVHVVMKHLRMKELEVELMKPFGKEYLSEMYQELSPEEHQGKKWPIKNGCVLRYKSFMFVLKD